MLKHAQIYKGCLNVRYVSYIPYLCQFFFLRCLASCPKYYFPLLWTDGPSHSNLSWPLHRRNSSSYYGKTICKLTYQHFRSMCSMNFKSQNSSNIYLFRIQMCFFSKLTVTQFPHQFVCLFFQWLSWFLCLSNGTLYMFEINT